jgi:hypothetical protein
MRKLILTSAVLLTTALGASTIALADKTSDGDHAKRLASMCTDHTAREIGHLAYLEAKLKPTSAQTDAWNTYKAAMTDQAKASEKTCLDRTANFKQGSKDHKRPTIIERNTMMEKRLEARLASIKATEPALEALYSKLDDSQKQVLDHQSSRHGKFANWRGHHRHGGMMIHKAHFSHHGKTTPDAPVKQ